MVAATVEMTVADATAARDALITAQRTAQQKRDELREQETELALAAFEEAPGAANKLALVRAALDTASTSLGHYQAGVQGANTRLARATDNAQREKSKTAWNGVRALCARRTATAQDLDTTIERLAALIHQQQADSMDAYNLAPIKSNTLLDSALTYEQLLTSVFQNMHRFGIPMRGQHQEKDTIKSVVEQSELGNHYLLCYAMPADPVVVEEAATADPVVVEEATGEHHAG